MDIETRDKRSVALDVLDSDNRPFGWMIFCPACQCGHFFTPDRWTFDGDYLEPTFTPSMLVHRPAKPATATQPAVPAFTCHSFVRYGRIEFLPDSTHALAGQTVDLEPFP